MNIDNVIEKVTKEIQRKYNENAYIDVKTNNDGERILIH